MPLKYDSIKSAKDEGDETHRPSNKKAANRSGGLWYSLIHAAVEQYVWDKRTRIVNILKTNSILKEPSGIQVSVSTQSSL